MKIYIHIVMTDILMTTPRQFRDIFKKLQKQPQSQWKIIEYREIFKIFEKIKKSLKNYFLSISECTWIFMFIFSSCLKPVFQF